MIDHNLPPIIDRDSTILILGSFPSVISREKSFYYMNKTNRFWKVLSIIYEDDFTNEDILIKTKLLIKNHISLYDVVTKCDIINSSDCSLSEKTIYKYIEIKEILNSTKINKIFINGKKAYELFEKRYPEYMHMVHLMPSTSAANAVMSLEDLVMKWKEIKG